MKFETSIKTIENIVDEKLAFSIPVYQRPYVWDNTEITKLLEDIYNNFEAGNKTYFVGNTYVIKSKANDFEKKYEVIDGQQRFTTFWLISYVFQILEIKSEITKYLEVELSNSTKDIRFDFDIRLEVYNYLKGLLDNTSNLKFENVEDKEFLKYIAKGIETIKGFLEAKEKNNNINVIFFGNYIYENVKFVFNIAPENTDLNALFTALGTSGIQLQQSDILKARLLDKIQKNNRLKYSKIWEACENMSNYFEKNVFEVFKYDRKNIKIEHFRTYSDVIFPVSEHIVENTSFKTISEIIKTELLETADEKKSEDYSKCRSIISFNLLLIHTYRIYKFQNQLPDLDKFIDPKKLLETVKLDNIKFPENFVELLWKVRYLFDQYVVKWRYEDYDDFSYDNDEKLLFTEIDSTVQNDNAYFSRRNKSLSNLQMLQSVLYFTGGYTQQYWLSPFLLYLLENQTNDENEILNKLEQIDNHLLPGEKLKKSYELMSDNVLVKTPLHFKNYLEQPLGTGFEHYWFYKLEYLLWKNWENKIDDKFKNYRITSKNSIEHVFPQNEEYNKKLDDLEVDWMNCFGNLALLSVGQNSSYSNQTVIKKQDDFKNKNNYDSLKLAKIYNSFSVDEEWDENKIRHHQKEMINLVENHYELII